MERDEPEEGDLFSAGDLGRYRSDSVYQLVGVVSCIFWWWLFLWPLPCLLTLALPPYQYQIIDAVNPVYQHLFLHRKSHPSSGINLSRMWAIANSSPDAYSAII